MTSNPTLQNQTQAKSNMKVIRLQSSQGQGQGQVRAPRKIRSAQATLGRMRIDALPGTTERFRPVRIPLFLCLLYLSSMK